MRGVECVQEAESGEKDKSQYLRIAGNPKDVDRFEQGKRSVLPVGFSGDSCLVS